MSSRADLRGQHLVRADRRFATGGGRMLGVLAPACKRVLDRVDAGILEGGIDVTLPDGSRRRLGFRSDGPVAIVHLQSWRAMLRLATSGSVGWYKAWEKGEWASPDPVPLFELFMRNGASLGSVGRAKGLWRLVNRTAHAVRANTPLRARRNIQAHYDLGNDFYSAWLDESMTYSSAVFEHLPPFVPSEVEGCGRKRTSTALGTNGKGESLEEGQRRKLRLLLDRLDLKPGQRLLEIGCGWGSLAIEAARRGNMGPVRGLTCRPRRKTMPIQRMKKAGLSDKVEIRLSTIASLTTFDAVASMKWSRPSPGILVRLSPRSARALKPWQPRGAAIYLDRSRLVRRLCGEPRLHPDLYFPRRHADKEPRFAAIAGSHDLSWDDRVGYGPDYAETLRQWRERYEVALQHGKLAGFGEAFHRLWRYYLMYCEGGFRGRGIDVAQVTLRRS